MSILGQLTLDAIVLLSFSFCAGAQYPAHERGCEFSSVSEGRKIEIARYARQKYKLGESLILNITKDEPAEAPCYRRLTFEGKGSLNVWNLVLYLSPDQRFLSTEIFDTTIDPAEEERRAAALLMTGLAQNKGASKGDDSAPVTIVEFSDFECPYCRNFATLLDQVLPGETGRVRIVFHHMPLSMHDWARTAAEGAACAQLQGSEAFWAMHDQLFRNQSVITGNNIKQKLTEFAAATKGLNTMAFQTCIENQLSLGLVFRDMNLASVNHVDGTPTLFINGNRITGVKDAEQLRQLIASAEKEAAGSIGLRGGSQAP